MNSCFAKHLAPKQLQRKYSTKWTTDLFEAHGIRWEQVIGVCIDVAPAMLGYHSSFQTLVKKSFQMQLVYTALFIAVPDELKSILNDVIKAMNLIEANVLNSRLFADLHKENYSDFKTLLLHSHVRWLSKEKVLKKSFVLRKEISV